MSERLIPPENIKSTIAAMQQVGFPAVNQQAQKQYVEKNSRKPDTSIFGKIAETVGAIGAMMTVATRQKETDPKEIEAKLGLWNPQDQSNKVNSLFAATGAALLIGSVNQQTVNGRLQEQNAPQQASQDTFRERREAAALAYQLDVKTVAPISSKKDDASTDKAAQEAMLNIAQRGTKGVVVAGSTSADAMIRENSATQEAQQKVRAEQSLNLFTEEEQGELQRWQQLATATDFENNYVLTEWRTAIMTIYQQREQNGTLNSEITQELVSQVGAISARIERNKETTRTMTMQPA
jgi:hypothetical protein